jgi:CTP:molybdopterin cytidylyltransferase MocA
MGQIKQLLPLGDRTVIEHGLSTIIAAGIKDIVVVLGPDAGDVSKTIHHFPVRTVLNTQQESEMAESVRTGLKSVSADATGILICLADHPLVMPETIKALVALHKNYPEAIIIPSCKRKRGHPTLFPGNIMQEIFVRNSLRDVIGSNAEKVRYLDVADDGVLLDMDTTEDYERILDNYHKRG